MSKRPSRKRKRRSGQTVAYASGSERHRNRRNKDRPSNACFGCVRGSGRDAGWRRATHFWLIREMRVSARFIPGFPCRAPPRHTPLHRNFGGVEREAKDIRPLVRITCTFDPTVCTSFLCKQVLGHRGAHGIAMLFWKEENTHFPDEPHFCRCTGTSWLGNGLAPAARKYANHLSIMGYR